MRGGGGGGGKLCAFLLEGQEEGVQWVEAQEARHELESLIRAEQLTL